MVLDESSLVLRKGMMPQSLFYSSKVPSYFDHERSSLFSEQDRDAFSLRELILVAAFCMCRSYFCKNWRCLHY